MRLGFGLFLLAASCAAHGQSTNLDQFREHFTSLRQKGLLPEPAMGGRSPLEPGGQGSAGGEGQEAPISQSGFVRVVHADSVDRDGDQIVAEGDVHLQYRGYDLKANRIVGDAKTQIFVLEGDVTVIGEDADLRGDTLRLDLKQEVYEGTNVIGTLRPNLLKGVVTDNVYINGSKLDKSRGEIHSHDGGFTTCDREHPHYELDGRYTTVRPEKRIILKDARLRVFGRTLLRIPYLVIPLDTRRNQYSPEFGQSPDQGYYVKSQWGIPVAGMNDANAIVDYFEKLGWGLGARYRYASASSSGFVRAYTLTGDRQTQELNFGHRQYFDNALFSFETNQQRRNYLNAPQNTIWQTRASLNMPQGSNNSRISYSRYSNESDTFNSVQENVGLSDQRRFAGLVRTNLDVSWTRARSEFTSTSNKREQVDVRFQGTKDFRKVMAELAYQRTIPVGETTNFFSTGDRTPVFTLKTDSTRLFGEQVTRSLPFQTEVSIGEFVNPSTKDRVTRSSFDINVSKPEVGTDRQGMGLNARFRQGVYSDGTAQFSTLLNWNYRYNLGKESSFNLRYNLLRPRGFTPLQIDRVGSTNYASADLSVSPLRRFVIGLQSAYDFRFEENGMPTPWQQVGLRTEWIPSDSLQVRGLSVYDPTLKLWSNSRFDLAYEAGGTFVGIGARYDGIRKTWGQVNAFFDGLKIGRVSATALFSYNGYTKRFDSQQYSITYDMHCTEAVLQVIENNVGFRSGREIYFFIRIKALPFDSKFGTGSQGQPFGTGTGFGF